MLWAGRKSSVKIKKNNQLSPKFFCPYRLPPSLSVVFPDVTTLAPS